MKERRPAKMTVGAATLITVLTVLCLTVFAVMSLVTAKSERELAEKTARSIADYWAADLICAEKAEDVLSAEDPKEYARGEGLSVTETEGGAFVAVTAAVDENQDLNYLIAVYGERAEIVSRTVSDTGAWTPDESVEVWFGK